MARIVYATALITLLTTIAGCPDGGAYRVPEPMMPADTYVVRPGATETDLVEEMAINRDAYEKALGQLVGYYSRSGDHMKLEMAQKELRSFQTMPKYKYIIGLTPGEYRAVSPEANADRIYIDARRLDKEARPLPPTRLITDQNKLRLALQQYVQLIRDYPTSDKVDDAAFFAGAILEEFAEYVPALDYYKIGYQSNPQTEYPARFKAAYILDNHMHRYAEALQLYNEALTTEATFGRHRQWKEYAEGRVREIQKLDEGEN